MEVFDKMIEARGLTNKNTIITYKNQYKKVIDLMDDDKFYEASEKKLKEAFEKSDLSARAKYNLINLVIMIKKHLEYKTDDLDAFRKSLQKQISEDTTDKLKTLDLPDYDDYFSKFDKSFAESKPQKYIVNKLIQMFGFRNLDLLLTIIKLNGRKKLPNDNINYMVVRKDRIELVISNYKTSKTHGVKYLTFTKKENPILFKTINKYYNDGNRFLLQKRNNEQIAIKSLSKTIDALTNNLGTGKLFKMIVKHLREEGKLNELKSMGESRGTNINTIISNYNMNDDS